MKFKLLNIEGNKSESIDISDKLINLKVNNISMNESPYWEYLANAITEPLSPLSIG